MSGPVAARVRRKKCRQCNARVTPDALADGRCESCAAAEVLPNTGSTLAVTAPSSRTIRVEAVSVPAVRDNGAAPSPGALSDDERGDLSRAEQVIEHGLQTFVEVGRALALIRDRKLYRATHPTFAAYVAERWGLTRSRAYQLVDAAKIADRVSTVVDIPIRNEAQARELVGLDVDTAAEVLRRAAATGRVTAVTLHEQRTVVTVYEQHLQPVAPEDELPVGTVLPSGQVVTGYLAGLPMLASPAEAGPRPAPPTPWQKRDGHVDVVLSALDDATVSASQAAESLAAAVAQGVGLTGHQYGEVGSRLQQIVASVQQIGTTLEQLREDARADQGRWAS